MKHTALLFCRAGYEPVCGQEAGLFLSQAGYTCTTDIRKGTGVVWIETDLPDSETLTGLLNLRSLIFTRQILWEAQRLPELPEKDKVSPVTRAVEVLFSKREPLFINASVITPDTDQSRDLTRFCKKFSTPLGNALKKSGLKKVYSRKDLPDIVVCFSSYNNAWVGLSLPGYSSPHEGGILRLKLPKDAPSRSTLKLEEAFHTFLSAKEQAEFLQTDKRVTDLGACPGGWTWQFVSRGMHVTAVDHGQIHPGLMKTGLVTHLETDAFTYKPKKRTDILVCDVADTPSKVSKMITHWMKNQMSDMVFCNLKLPMKKKIEEVRKCLEIICTEGEVHQADRLEVSHLYHDRDEVTLFWKKGRRRR